MSTDSTVSQAPLDGLAGLRQNFVADLSAGFVAFLLALPLSLGIAGASGFPPVMGLVTAIIGGLVATWFAGSRLTIKGPAAGLIVIVLGAVNAYGGGEEGWRMALGIMVIAGLCQIAFGVLKFGRFVDVFPLAAVHGMLAAIGIIIIAKQVPVLLAVDPTLAKGKGPIELIAAIPEFFANLNPMVAVLGFVCLAIMFIWPMIAKGKLKAVPAPLIVLLVAIPASIYLDLKTTAPGYALVKVGRIMDQVGINVSFEGVSQIGVFIKYVFMVTIVGSLESLLTVKAIDQLDPYHRKSDPNKDIIAVGIANTLAGVLGGLPMISEVARSSANVANGAKTRFANLFHGLFLLVAALAAYQVLELIPSAALAAMLIAVGVKLAHPKEFIHTYKIGADQLAIFVTTIFFTLFEDLLIGIAAGMALKVLIHVLRGAPLRDLFRGDVQRETTEDGTILVRLGSTATFTNYLGLKKVLDGLPSGERVVIRADQTRLVDHSVIENLHHFAHDYRMAGGEVDLGALESLQPTSSHPLSARIKKAHDWGMQAEPFALAANVRFDESRLLHDLAHFLPQQLALKDFIHHNTLHAYQDQEFFEGIFSAGRIFGIKTTLSLNTYRRLYNSGRIRPEVLDRILQERVGSKGVSGFRQNMLEGKYDHPNDAFIGRLRKNWSRHYQLDLDSAVQPRLFRILAAYIDQGIAPKAFPASELGLLDAIRAVEKESFVSFFRTKRVQRLLFDERLSLENLLALVVGDSRYYDQYVFDQQFGHKGYSGLIAAIEGQPSTLLDRRPVTLRELIMLDLLLEVDALDDRLGTSWQPIAKLTTDEPRDYFHKVDMGEFEEVLQVWQQAFEWSYYDEVLAGVGELVKRPRSIKAFHRPVFEAVFCVDDRECSLRRHIEAVEPNAKTYGAPGHFGLTIAFQPDGGQFLEKNCPAPATPSHLIREIHRPEPAVVKSFQHKHSHHVVQDTVHTFWGGLKAIVRLPLDVLRPNQRPDLANAFAHVHEGSKLEVEFKGTHSHNLPVGYTPMEMANAVEALLKSIGIDAAQLAPVVYLVGHGSTTANNPHYAAYNCGACSGRPGSINARTFAALANHPEARKILLERGVQIPADTQFVGGLHDTSSEQIKWYDTDVLTEANTKRHLRNAEAMEEALDRNAKERARRFASIDAGADNKLARKLIYQRSHNYAEPRAELNHGSNALCYVGNRERIRGLFLDRRSFLASYDYRLDPQGKALATVLGPLPIVCGGINLEYYFSRMDNEAMGAGTKLPHQVMGAVAVSNGSDGDLRTGLHWQTVENHDPIRLMMIIEQRREVVLEVLNSQPDNKAWFDQGWIHLVVTDPQDSKLYHYVGDGFEEYSPLAAVKRVDDIEKVLAKAPRMATADIVDATTENIPVHVYDN